LIFEKAEDHLIGKLVEPRPSLGHPNWPADFNEAGENGRGKRQKTYRKGGGQ
jgi:hypothetical protein